jgi:hypothetical protein
MAHGAAFADTSGARLTERTYAGQDRTGLLAEDVAGADRGGQTGYPSLAALESVKFRGENGRTSASAGWTRRRG